jgi:hypothetical protein
MSSNEKLDVSVVRLRELKKSVDAFVKTRGVDDLADVANKLANIYSEIIGIDCVLKVSGKR